MTDREKLIALHYKATSYAANLCANTDCDACQYGECEGDCFDAAKFDYLLANGVVVREWIPVTERLPEKSGYYLTWWHGHSCPEGMMDVLNFDGTVFPCETLFPSCKNTVTHWMPMPEPPTRKGENDG